MSAEQKSLVQRRQGRIQFNGVKINEPLSKEPTYLDFCWFLNRDNQLFGDTWHGFAWQKLMLKDGRCFATEQDAQPAYGAITLALTEKKQ